jgi:hypothetical protein
MQTFSFSYLHQPQREFGGNFFIRLLPISGTILERGSCFSVSASCGDRDFAREHFNNSSPELADDETFGRDRAFDVTGCIWGDLDGRGFSFSVVGEFIIAGRSKGAMEGDSLGTEGFGCFIGGEGSVLFDLGNEPRCVVIFPYAG